MNENLHRRENGTCKSVFSIIHWRNPDCALPEEASYILLKQYAEGGGFLCEEAAFEGGSFWPVGGMQDEPYDPRIIAGWAFFHTMGEMRRNKMCNGKKLPECPPYDAPLIPFDN